MVSQNQKIKQKVVESQSGPNGVTVIVFTRQKWNLNFVQMELKEEERSNVNRTVPSMEEKENIGKDIQLKNVEIGKWNQMHWNLSSWMTQLEFVNEQNG